MHGSTAFCEPSNIPVAAAAAAFYPGQHSSVATAAAATSVTAAEWEHNLKN